MEEKHKYLLRRNRSNLVRSLDPSSVCDGLLEKGLFSQDEVAIIKSKGTKRDQARKLLQDLETCGNQAFLLFLECLKETGQHNLVESLQKSPPPAQIKAIKLPPSGRPFVKPLPVICPINNGEKCKDLPLSPKKEPTTPSPSPDYLRPRQDGRTRRDSLRCYKMDAIPCGHCLIINNMDFEPQTNLNNRKGSDVDCVKMEKRFKALNFVVEVKTNLKQRQIRQELSALSKKDHSQYDCCVVVILSHGTSVNHNRFPGAVYGVDGGYVPVQHITNALNGQSCLSLQGKPKLFFIQACGGEEKDMGFEVSPDEARPSIGGMNDQTDALPFSFSSDSLSSCDEIDARASLPTASDILVSYSTFPGFVSWRDTQAGSWYVETFDQILEANAETDDLVTMLMMVNDEVSQNSAKGVFKQMPGSFNFLRKLLYFQTTK